MPYQLGDTPKTRVFYVKTLTIAYGGWQLYSGARFHREPVFTEGRSPHKGDSAIALAAMPLARKPFTRRAFIRGSVLSDNASSAACASFLFSKLANTLAPVPVILAVANWPSQIMALSTSGYSFLTSASQSFLELSTSETGDCPARKAAILIAVVSRVNS